MSYYRGPAYPPRKRSRGDYYDGGDRYNRPRQSPEESILTRLRRDFISIAEPKPNSSATAADDIDYVAKSIVSEYSKADSVKSGIHELVYNCLLELPPKIPYFASLFVVVNARKQVIGKDILDFSIAKLKEILEQGDLGKAKLMLRFLAGLTRIVEADGIMDVIGEIISKFEGEGANARMDSLARLVLLTLPYIVVSSKKPTAALDAVVERISTYMESRDIDETSFITPHQTANADPLGDYSTLHLLWLQTKTLKDNEWDIPFLPRPWFAFRTELESNTKTHPIPPFSLTLDIASIPPLEPEYYFSIFLNNDKHTVPHLSSIASTLLRDIITDTYHQLVFNRKESSRLLIDLQSYFPTGLFHRPGLSIKELPPPQPSRPKYKLEDLLVDSIFSSLFRLPVPRDAEVFYAALLTEIILRAPQDIAPTLGRAIRWIYEHLDELKGELNMRFSSWFSAHLSNFGFTYKWEEWTGDLELEDGAPKKVFLRETIEREVRLSYLERIQQSLPEEYFRLLPLKADTDEWKPISDRFGGGGDEGSEKLIEALRTREDPAILNYVEGNPNCGDILVAGVLYVSRETPYSYVLSPATLELVKKHTTPPSLIGTIMSFWKERPSTGTVLVMKYVDLGVITLNDVVSWLLEQDSWMSKSWGWDIMQTCDVKMKNVSARLQKASDIKPIDSKAADDNAADGNDKETDKPADAMQVDSQTVANGTTTRNERRELLTHIIAGIGSCYARQNEQDQYWLKEWLAMIVRKSNSEVAGLEGADWVGEMLASAEKYSERLA